MRYAVDVDAARRDVGRHQHAQPVLLKLARARSRWLCDLLPWIAAVSMRFWIRPFTTLSAPCFVRVNPAWRHGVLLKQIEQQRKFVAGFDMDDALIDAHRRCRLGVISTHTGSLRRAAARPAISFGMVAERTDSGAWPARGRDLADGMNEAQIEHLVDFVENENLDFCKAQHAPVDEIDKPAWRRNHDIDALATARIWLLMETPPKTVACDTRRNLP